MIRGFAVLLLCQVVGEMAAYGLALPVPGPVIGLALLVAGLWGWNRFRSEPEPATSDVGRVSDGLLGVLVLLFVPAGVGVVQYLGLIGTYGLALGAALLVSTFLTLLVTVGTFLAVKRFMARRI